MENPEWREMCNRNLGYSQHFQKNFLFDLISFKTVFDLLTAKCGDIFCLLVAANTINNFSVFTNNFSGSLLLEQTLL